MKRGISSIFIQLVTKKSKQEPVSRQQLFHHTPVLFHKKKPENFGYKKRQIAASNYVKTMADRGDKVALELEPLRKSVKEQGEFFYMFQKLM